MKANMTHPPQEVLIKVMCSERLPDVKGYQLCDDTKMFQFYYFNDITRYWYTNPLQLDLVFPTVWYEPATRIVLTEEEYKEMESERLAFKDFIQWMFDHKYSQVENVDIPSETIRFIHNRLGYANP